MAMTVVNPTLDRAANINALNRIYANPTTPSVVSGSQIQAERVNALNRIYANPTTAHVLDARSTNISLPPEAKISARAAQIEQQTSRYGSSRGLALGGGFALGYLSQQADADAKSRARSQARSEWLKTPDGQKYQQLTNNFIDTYGGSGGLTWERYVAGFRSQDNATLQDFGKLQAQAAYNDKLQKSIDAYQAKPENRRKLYDDLVNQGKLTPPAGYQSEPLDRYEQQYGKEKSVSEVGPYADLTPNYGDLKPDIVYHPDGTVTYEKPDPNSSNTPLVLGPSSNSGPIDFTLPDVNNQFSNKVRIKFYSPNNRIDVVQEVTSFRIIQYPAGPGITWDNNQTGPLLDPSTLKVEPINGSSTVPTNRPSSTSTPQPIPTKPDGSADLKPFNPTTPDPTNSRQSAPQNSPSPTASPKLSDVPKVDGSQQAQPSLPLGSLAPLLAGLPLALPLLSPKGLPQAPGIPSSGVGENNPVKATSLNPGTSTGTITGTPPMVSVPTTSNPTKVDNKTAAKAQEQLGTKPSTEPQTQPKSPKSCEDPCMQRLQDSAQGSDSILKKIASAVGVDAFPVRAQLLSDSGASGMISYSNLAELAVWNTKNVDAVTGLFPLEIPIVDENGKESNVKIESVSHAFYELFSLLKVIAEDADAAVNVGSRAVIEAIQSKISARQAGEYAKGNAKFLGYLGQGKQREIKLTVTPAAAGLDNKLQNQEIADFLKPSTQHYVGWECLEKVSLLPIVQRTLEDGEIARSALFQPLKEGKKPEQSTIPGTSIKYDKKHIKAQEKAWEAFKEELKKEGKIIDDKQGQKDVKS